MDFLFKEKSLVKKELILFDKSFYNKVGRYPNDKEKQKMTKSYIYY